MSLSRWKMMAGVLGVSLGGLAAIAGQCPKTDANKSAPPDTPVASSPMPPAPGPVPQLPPLPAPGVEPAKVPTVPASSPPAPPMPVVPAGGTTLPALPDLPPPPPSTGPALPPPSSTPPAPPSPVDPLVGKPTPPTTPPTPPAPPADTLPPAPPGLPPRVPPSDPVVDTPPVDVTKRAATGGVAGVTTVPQPKYRILLRVGEGEPTFEVRCGDDLMLKVICEKVDVKSPEKGQGLSAVKASGKVRFAGFGAEGTCNELSFLAGTGEVAMSGHVKIQVKDKLGRVESELSAETMKYKIDPHTIVGNGTMRP